MELLSSDVFASVLGCACFFKPDMTKYVYDVVFVNQGREGTGLYCRKGTGRN